MATFRVRETDHDGHTTDNDFEWQGDAKECFEQAQNDDNQSVEFFNVWSWGTGTEDCVNEWHNPNC